VISSFTIGARAPHRGIEPRAAGLEDQLGILTVGQERHRSESNRG
jgi:hypothetical protein